MEDLKFDAGKVDVSSLVSHPTFDFAPDASKLDWQGLLDVMFKVYSLPSGGSVQMFGISITSEVLQALPEHLRQHFKPKAP